MTAKPNPKILWLTNLPAPYRFPIWDQIARKCDLKIAFLLKETNWRDWSIPKKANWKYQFLSLNSKRFREFDFIFSIRGSKRILKGVELVIIGGWESAFYWRTLRSAKIRNIPVIQFYESTQASHRFNNFLIRKIRSTIFSKADFIVTVGSASTKAVEAMGITPQKIITLFNPVDVSWFHSFAQRNRAQQTSGHRFIYVGQLIQRKNVAEVVRAFAAIRSESDTLTIVGDGALSQSLKELTQTLGISDSVFFAGHKNQEELAEFYAKSHTLILASTNEVWGLVVNEALASGLHVVVSEKCGVAEFVKDMKGAYVCATDQESIQESMLKSSQEWSGYIENPKVLKFTPEKFADRLLEVIDCGF
jgi:glycosyltransferase involved in cell wall biosynthesis